MSMFGLDSIAKMFNNPIVTILLAIGTILIIFYFLNKGEIKKSMKVFYFAEVERLISPLDVVKLSPKSVHTKDEKRFLRRAKSWLWKDRSNTCVTWLGKVGKALSYRLEQNQKDDDGNPIVEKIGTLLEGISICLGLDEETPITVETFDQDALDKLNESKIFVCVDLDDDDILPNLTEEGALSEADRAMSDLVGEKVKQKLHKEDWIRNGGLMAIGALIYVLAQQIGVL